VDGSPGAAALLDEIRRPTADLERLAAMVGRSDFETRRDAADMVVRDGRGRE
jgi:hypothetical protein